MSAKEAREALDRVRAESFLFEQCSILSEALDEHDALRERVESLELELGAERELLAISVASSRDLRAQLAATPDLSALVKIRELVSSEEYEPREALQQIDEVACGVIARALEQVRASQDKTKGHTINSGNLSDARDLELAVAAGRAGNQKHQLVYVPDDIESQVKCKVCGLRYRILDGRRLRDCQHQIDQHFSKACEWGGL